MRDEIIEEVWKAEEALAAKCSHDVKELVAYLRRQEAASNVTSVDLRAQRSELAAQPRAV